MPQTRLYIPHEAERSFPGPQPLCRPYRSINALTADNIDATNEHRIFLNLPVAIEGNFFSIEKTVNFFWFKTVLMQRPAIHPLIYKQIPSWSCRPLGIKKPVSQALFMNIEPGTHTTQPSRKSMFRHIKMQLMSSRIEW